MKEPVTYLSAFYTDEEDLIKGIKRMKDQGIKILDVRTPFPVHGMDKLLGYRRSWIPRIGFIGGAIGAAAGFYFQTWIFTKDYPVQIGGKPYFAVPSFIPVTFESAVLFAAFAMVIAFFVRSKLGPGAKAEIYDERTTDDHFLVIVDTEKGNETVENKLKTILEETRGTLEETQNIKS